MISPKHPNPRRFNPIPLTNNQPFSRPGDNGSGAFNVCSAANVTVQQSFGGEIGQGFAEGLRVDLISTGEQSLAGQLSAKLTVADGGSETFAQALEFIAKSVQGMDDGKGGSRVEYQIDR